MNLLRETQKLLSETHMSPIEISQKSGLGQRWIYLFMTGGIKNPGVVNVQTLHDFLMVSNSNTNASEKQTANNQSSNVLMNDHKEAVA